MGIVIEKYTYEDYKNWEGDWELINGTAVAMAPAPMIRHQNIATNFIYELKNNLEDCEECEVLVEVDYKIDEYTTVRPDVVLTCGEENEYYLTNAPKIIIEIISKSTARIDEKIKYELYEKEGVLYYILVYPDDLRAKIFKLKDGKYRKEGDFLTEKYIFKDIPCETQINFDNVFKKFRKRKK